MQKNIAETAFKTFICSDATTKSEAN